MVFQRRGDISLYPDRLVLDGWTDSGDLVLTRPEITSVETRFTELYGRFIGGLLNAGKPLILRTGPMPRHTPASVAAHPLKWVCSDRTRCAAQV
ncbi:MAG: hypothetical protein QOF99_664 [Pseudonocardiales bacterium]|nr:hypothetical protein [Pseudonocardiales bacterium]